MAWFGKIILIVSLGLLVIGLQHSSATPSLAISTSKQTYEYGDHLSLIFDVSELTGDSITIQIIDSSGKASTPIPIPITNLRTEITAPDAFYKTIYKSGTYHIDATYSGVNATAVFTLIDSNKVAIPS